MARASGTLSINTRNSNSVSVFRHVRWEHLAAGVSGGVLSTLTLHPLDLIKVRFQVNEGAALASNRPQYTGVFNAVVKIYQTEGVKGLYRGVTPNVWGAGASWGLYFLFYNSLKTYMQDGNSLVSLSAGTHMGCAAASGLMTLALTNPIWVAKTRLCLQYETMASSMDATSHTYKGMADCINKIYRIEGIRGLYKGFLPGTVGVSHGALQFMAYEEMKKSYNKYRNVPVNTKFTYFEYITFAALSKIFAACTTYPYQVVRARLQDQHRSYAGIWDVIKQTYRFEGMRGFFKGMSPYIIHVTPNIIIVFSVYEYFQNRTSDKTVTAEQQSSQSHSVSPTRKGS